MAFEDSDDVDLKGGSDFTQVMEIVKVVVSQARAMMPEAKKWVKENSDLVSDAVSCLLDVVLDVGKGLNKQNAELTALSAKWKMQSMKALMKEGFSRAEAMQIILAQVSHSTNWANLVNNMGKKSAK